MPKTPPPSARGGSRRSAPTKVSKPFPWGTVLGSGVLALVLIGVVAYAALNQGSGRNQVVVDPDRAIAGVSVASGKLGRGHVQGAVKYDQMPPNAGDHNALPQQCAVYDEEIAPEHALHSLEHGAVWVTYADGVSDADVKALASKVEGDPYRLMSPVAAQSSPIVLSAWGRSLSVDRADDERVDDFLLGYTRGPQAPERGAACVGNTTTGPVQAAAVPDGAVLPSGAATPAPAPSS